MNTVDPRLIAIAAMAENRVIGRNGGIPWHLPEDFRWFKRTTLGHIVLMGRRTYESLGKPLPGRENIVLSRQGGTFAGAQTLRSMDELQLPEDGRRVFVIGGAEIYRQLLPRCGTFYLSLVYGSPEGDTFLPEFEDTFDLVEVLARFPEFEIRHYRNKHGIETLSLNQNPRLQ